MQVSIEQRMAGAAKVGEHKTSMLQDLEAGRPLELEAIVGAVLEVGKELGYPAHTRSVLRLYEIAAAERRSAGNAKNLNLRGHHEPQRWSQFEALLYAYYDRQPTVRLGVVCEAAPGRPQRAGVSWHFKPRQLFS